VGAEIESKGVHFTGGEGGIHENRGQGERGRDKEKKQGVGGVGAGDFPEIRGSARPADG